MGTITALGLLLLICMVVVGGTQGLQAWISLIFNFAALFFAMVLMAFHLSPVLVTLVTGVIVLAMTIFLGGNDSNSTMVAFYASVAVLILLVILIIPIEHWAQIQGFGQEDSEDLEGMSTILGISYLNVAVSTAILSTLGAIAEAAIAIAAGLAEILEQHPKITLKNLQGAGFKVGSQIIGTTFNTLFFGFFGGFLALFIWFAGVHYSLGEILNDKILVGEVLMVLFSMMSVIATIPLTTWAMVASERQARKKFVK
ncbi:YibE/F family protein [Lactobacillus sp. LC28-10]|uniref:YibE/F family protein n=1 Tax=Secundilactobacillus angelensis TaxID=2722706 RepID=A0ABX1KW35_9LACO|nr:YibE/F family protein [Secundilactobacillus angelensis]MCH5462371.1 YibE/F family protein [Secundilactobacillus angelensis]NLR18147.1 YibE/F family protein [Secundilactobacillus angelensis]